MTDKELKKLSRLELLELLLVESRENERLREELEKIKQENTIKKSAEHLEVASKQIETAMEQVSEIINNLSSGAFVVSDRPVSAAKASAVEHTGWQMPKQPEKKKAPAGSKKGIFNMLSKDKAEGSAESRKKSKK